ncbi:hypothetical protein SK128_003006, partial [Halocaridina rubra]
MVVLGGAGFDPTYVVRPHDLSPMSTGRSPILNTRRIFTIDQPNTFPNPISRRSSLPDGDAERQNTMLTSSVTKDTLMETRGVPIQDEIIPLCDLTQQPLDHLATQFSRKK